jgi:hypothetical protein
MDWKCFRSKLLSELIIICICIKIVVLEDVKVVHEVTNLPFSRTNLAVASAGNRYAVFAGGYNGTYLKTVDIYDVHERTWLTSTSLLQPKAFMAATSVGNTAYFAGGANETNISRLLEALTIDTEHGAKWEWNRTVLKEARKNMAATSVGLFAIFAGGETVDGSVTDTVDILDTSTGNLTASKLSVARKDLSGASAAIWAVFAGGFDGEGYSAVVEVYNVANKTWSRLDDLTVARSLMAASTVKATGINTFGCY